jgi:hypothetical protein
LHFYCRIANQPEIEMKKIYISTHRYHPHARHVLS